MCQGYVESVITFFLLEVGMYKEADSSDQKVKIHYIITGVFFHLYSNVSVNDFAFSACNCMKKANNPIATLLGMST